MEHQPTALSSAPVSRRRLLAGTGAATAVAATAGGVALGSSPAGAHENFRAKPLPRPIPGTVPAPPLGDIHWALPGPAGATTPIIGIPAFGLDAEPSTFTDFHGYTAYAVVAGKVKVNRSVELDCEFDVRVMKGRYVAEDGNEYRGTFAFF